MSSIFSTLRSFATKTVATGNNLCDSVEKTSELMSKLTTLEGPFENVILDTADIAQRVNTTTIPMVEQAVDKATETLSSMQRIFSTLEKLVAPLLKLNDFMMTTWSAVSKLLFSIFGVASKHGEGLLSFLTEMLPEDVTLPVALVVFVGSLLILKFLLPSTMLESFLSLVGNCVIMVKGFVVGLLPTRFTTWFSSFFSEAQNELVAQGPSTFGAEVSGFTFADVVASVVSVGFISLLYSIIGTDKPGRGNANPVSGILCAAGDHAAKINHLFTFFRNVKSSLGDTLMWVGEWLCEVTGFASPLSATVNMVLNTELFTWFNDVNVAVDPAKRLENFSNPHFTIEASLLKDKVAYFEAQFVKFPVSPFVTGRFNAAVTKLDKLLVDAHSHKGVGQFRDEPFCVQLYGVPGCGKTMSIGFIIEDLLNRMGEPKNNRLYSLSSKDGYWSNYNHQVAVLIDDFGQILDSANQNDGVKDFIFMKSSAPMSLPMAAVEEKGTQFTSKYIFLTSNFASPAKTAGVMDIEAVQRRRNLLIEVERIGPIDENVKTPVDNIVYTVRNSLQPHYRVAGQERLSYMELLDVLEMACKKHWDKDQWLKQFSGGIEKILEAQVQPTSETSDEVAPRPEDQVSFEYQLSSFQYAYRGLLDLENPFQEGTTPHTHYECVGSEMQMSFFQWKMNLLTNSIKDVEIVFWEEQIQESQRRNFMAWIPYFTFSESQFAQRLSMGQGYMQQCVNSDDVDALDAFNSLNERSRFAFALIVRHYCALKYKAEHSKRKPSFAKQVVDYIKKIWDDAPHAIKLAIQIYAAFKCASLAFDLIRSFLPTPVAAVVATDVANSTVLHALGNGGGKNNISGDQVTNRGQSNRRGKDFLTAHSTPSEDWALWALKDPFANDALIKNLVVLRLPTSEIFRGVYVKAGWILTVGHAFHQCPDGMGFQVVHQHSVASVCLDKSHEFYKPIPNQDLVLIYVGDVDGVKKDIIKHFAKRNGIMCTNGSKGVLAKPIFDSTAAGQLVSLDMKGVLMLDSIDGPVAYSHGEFKIQSLTMASFEYVGHNGDCGSLLLLPQIGNRQPVISGIHCAGLTEEYVKRGSKLCYAAIVFQEELLELLPKSLLTAQGPCPVLAQLRRETQNPFEIKQVALMGTVPSELAVNVPHKTTLRKTELFENLITAIGPHLTEPSILTKRDARLPSDSTFDPYIKGVEKFNETASNFDMKCAKVVMEHMSNDLLLKLSQVEVPGGKPILRSEREVLNGLPGEKFYDSMDMSTACGYPFTLSEYGKSKRGYLDGEPGDYVLHRQRPVYPEYCQMELEVREGIVSDLVSCECAKDERLPLEKIYDKPKTRLFTILPFHYNMLVRRYFLDFSASLMRAHNDVSCKVGINPGSIEWTQLANDFLRVSDVGFSADYSSFDGRAPVFIFQWFCDMVDAYYGDAPFSANSKARHALLMMASNHYTLCGDQLFRVVGGMPSGFSLTVLFNSLLNEFYMRYAFEKLRQHPKNSARALGVTQRDFKDLYVAIYGDDNLVAVPLHLRWYSLPDIAAELLNINVIIKNGLDKNQDVNEVQFQPLGELTFLSRGFSRHSLGYYRAPLKWVSIIEPLRWIRPTPECPPIDALMQNIEGSLREAFMHGEAVFNGLRNTIIEVLTQRHLPVGNLVFYKELERQWLAEVTMKEPEQIVGTMEQHILELKKVPALTADECTRCVNEFVPGIYFCGARTAKKSVVQTEYIIVNCLTSKHSSWIRGPATWMDLDNKIWAYTMSAINIEQSARIQSGLGTKLLFVCAGGFGMSIVCAALAAMASSQYTKDQIIVRYRQLTTCNNLSVMAGGAGHYLVLAAQQGNVGGPSQGSCSIVGTNIYDRCLSVHNCRIITGVNPPGVLPGTFACTQVAGTDGVKTSAHFIRNEDPLSGKLASVIKFAEREGAILYLFFTTFRSLEAEWVLSAIRKAGVGLPDVVSADLLLLERQARLIENSAHGRVWVEISDQSNPKYAVFTKKVEVITLGDWGIQKHTIGRTKPLPLPSTAFNTVASLREALPFVENGMYHLTSVLEVLKLVYASGGAQYHCDLQKEILKFYPVAGSIAHMEMTLALLFWRGSGSDQMSNAIPDPIVKIFNEEFKYVVQDVTTEEFSWTFFQGGDYGATVEALGLSLRLAYSHSAIRGHSIFRLPKSMDNLTYLLFAIKLENEVRKEKKEQLMELPSWYPEHHKIINALSCLTFNYL